MSSIKIDASGILPLIARIGPSNKKMTCTVADQVAKDTVDYVPALNENFSNRTRVVGSRIIYDKPFARYLYFGKVMEGPLHGRKHATDKNLVFSKQPHPKATAHWFEKSKEANMDTWEEVAKRAFLDGIKK